MSFSTRLARAFGHLLLALLNATLVLVILAALAIGFAVHAVRDAAETGAQRAAAAALSAAEIEPGEMRAALVALTQEIEQLRAGLETAAGQEELAASLADVEARLSEVREALRALSSPTIRIDPATVAALTAAAQALIDRLVEIGRDAPAGQ